MAWHYAPVIRQMENARVSAGLLTSYSSVGFTERVAVEGVTQPLPVDYPAAANNWFYFGGQRISPTP
jgi:hypothetical protein